MVNRYMKRCSTSLIIREIQIKIIMRYHLRLVRMAKINTGNEELLARMWRKGNPLALLEMQTDADTLENSMDVPQKVKHRTTL